MKVLPVVLCGGAGTRLWPMSRENFPKQLLALNGDQSLLQQTAARLQGLKSPRGEAAAAPFVVCNEEHRFLVAEQLLGEIFARHRPQARARAAAKDYRQDLHDSPPCVRPPSSSRSDQARNSVFVIR